MKTKLIGCILFLILLPSVTCFAQVVESETPKTISVFTGAQSYSRTLEGETDETARQLVFPLFVSAMVTDSLNLRLYQTISTSELEDGPGLDGLENTRIRGSLGLFENRLALYLGAGLPIFEDTLEADTEDLSELLYRESLQFGVSRLTEGFDLDGGFAFVQPFGRLAFGVGAGYTMRGSFDKLAQKGSLISYEPGDAISTNAGLHFYTGQVALYGGASYFYYADDKVGEDFSFENGNELSFLAATRFQPEPFTITLYGIDTIKSGSDVSEDADISNFFTNRVNAGVSLAYSLFSDTLILKTQGNLKWFIDEDETEAKVISFGGGFQLVITDNVALDVLGSLVIGDMEFGETDISGFNLNSVVRVGF